MADIKASKTRKETFIYRKKIINYKKVIIV